MAPLPELNVSFVPDDHGVDSLTRQIRMTGRAYPLFEIARMVLQKPERHTITITIKKDAQDQPKQPLFSCAVDNTVWLAEADAIRHALLKHFDLFYQAERTPVEPPKGTYTFVAQCGMSGVILGPPNYHDYQKQLRKLHTERFAKMPFDVFKSRVKIVRDEEVVKRWVDDQSFRTEYVCLNMPESIKLGTREEVERHFRATHVPNIIQPVESFHLTGNAIREVRTPALARLIRHRLEEQRRFPLQVMTSLSQQFAARGLQFFKVNRTVTHVAVARPHYLDLESIPVSEGVRRIVDYIHQHPHCNRKDLVETLAPAPAPAPPQEGAPAEAAAAEPTPEQTAIITDLHWLIHQGHVIEFATGVLETAKKPVQKPPKPEKAEPSPEKPVAAEEPPDAGTAQAPPADAAAVAEVVSSDQPSPDEGAAPETNSIPPPAASAPGDPASPGREDTPAAAADEPIPTPQEPPSDAAPVEGSEPEAAEEERGPEPEATAPPGPDGLPEEKPKPGESAADA